MPLAYAALLGGLNTLIGTPPNILISEALKEAGLRPFSMFEFTPVGISVLLAGTLYMAVAGRRLLPSRDPAREFAEKRARDNKALYDMHERMMMLHLPAGSILEGKTLAQSRLGAVLRLTVVAVMRNGNTFLSPEPAFTLRSGDRLLVGGNPDQFTTLHHKNNFVVEKEGFTVERLVSANVKLVEARLSPGSILIGQTLRQVGFRHIYNVVVLAILREGIPFRTNLENIPLLGDDVLLLQGRSEAFETLMADPNLVISQPTSLKDFKLDERLMVVHVPADSALVGKSLIESHLGDSYGLGVLGIIRADETNLIPSPQEILQVGDTLLVKGKQSDMQLIEGLQNLDIEEQPVPDLGNLESEEIGLVEAVLSPHSNLSGKNLRELNFRFKYGLTVLAVWREGRAYRSNLRDMNLRFGDAL
jgi:uncharacterized protein with PhoU and TrkA domain